MPQNSVLQQYPSNYPGMQYQFSNIQIGLLGTYFPFVMSLSYSDTNDIAEGRGVSPYPMGTTLGEYKAQGSIEVQKLYNEQFLNLIAAQSPAGNSIYDAIFDITVQYQLRVPQGLPQPPVTTDVLKACRLTGQSQDLSSGNGVLSVKYQVYVALITWGGRLPIADMPQ